MKTILMAVRAGLLLMLLIFSTTGFAHSGEPTAPLIINGYTAAVRGTQLTFSVQGYPGVLGYYWTYPRGWKVVKGQGSATITFITTGSSASGEVRVEEIRKDRKRTTAMEVILLEADTGQPVNAGMPFDMRVFPVASSTHFRVQTKAGNSNAPMKLMVYDLQGHTLKGRDLVPGAPLRIGDDLEPGVYVIEVVQGVVRKQTRVIKE